jgi:acetyl esterase/lipase
VSFDPRGPHDVVHEDVEYARPGGEALLARIYRPAGAHPPLPALVDVHGGAWSYFDRTADTYFDRALTACGMVVVALDFRQAPAHRYPTAVADVVAGIRWTKANAEHLGLNSHSLGLIGGSSGGHLLMLAALRPSAPEFNTTPCPSGRSSTRSPATATCSPAAPIRSPRATRSSSPSA